MRVLFSSTRGAGHFNPLVPFANAFVRAGHELLFAGPPDLAGPVDAAGFRLCFPQALPVYDVALRAVSELPVVVVPLFADQPQNARRVGEVGAGLAVEPNREDLDTTVEPLRDAIQSVLSDPPYGQKARALADELRTQPPVDDAVPLFERFGRS